MSLPLSKSSAAPASLEMPVLHPGSGPACLLCNLSTHSTGGANARTSSLTGILQLVHLCPSCHYHQRCPFSTTHPSGAQPHPSELHPRSGTCTSRSGIALVQTGAGTGTTHTERSQQPEKCAIFNQMPLAGCQAPAFGTWICTRSLPPRPFP